MKHCFFALGVAASAVGCLVVTCLVPSAAAAQTTLDQEQRLIQIHSLLVALPPLTSPEGYEPWQVSLGAELIVIPTISGQIGGRVPPEITASDRTPVFPRPRLAIGLPAPEDFRAYVGATYLPPFEINGASSHELGLEAAYAWVPQGPLSVALRGFALFAESKSPVTDPNTRDTLDSFDGGGDLSAGYRLDFEPLSLTPFAGVGVTYAAGNFRVFSDNELLTSNTVNLSLEAGVRVRMGLGFDAVGQVVAYPGVLVHPVFALAWTPHL
ncbi:MAG TPA: autotransporter outer membrane beta-barrel domain-containing protein [Myxococcales bacterium]|jgi:hypothetical protein